MQAVTLPLMPAAPLPVVAGMADSTQGTGQFGALVQAQGATAMTAPAAPTLVPGRALPVAAGEAVASDPAVPEIGAPNGGPVDVTSPTTALPVSMPPKDLGAPPPEVAAPLAEPLPAADAAEMAAPPATPAVPAKPTLSAKPPVVGSDDPVPTEEAPVATPMIEATQPEVERVATPPSETSEVAATPVDAAEDDAPTAHAPLPLPQVASPPENQAAHVAAISLARPEAIAPQPDTSSEAEPDGAPVAPRDVSAAAMTIAPVQTAAVPNPTAKPAAATAPAGDTNAAVAASADRSSVDQPQQEMAARITTVETSGSAEAAPEANASRSIDASRPSAETPAEKTLPAPLLTQTMHHAAAKPVGTPYPVASHAAAQTPVVQVRPGKMGADMGIEIARAVRNDREDLVIRLDPRDMGRIDVRLSFDRDGMLRAVMSADNPAALDLLKRESGDLNRALADAGVRADGQSLRFDSQPGEQRGGAGQFSGQDGRRHFAGQGGNGRDDGAGGALAENIPTRSLRSSGHVDLLA